ncbi:endochitinase A-like [Argonauta hians]
MGLVGEFEYLIDKCVEEGVDKSPGKYRVRLFEIEIWMKVPSGQQVNRQTTRILRVGPQNILRANITTEVKYVNSGTVFPRVTPYQTPSAALSKTPYNGCVRNPLPLLPKSSENSVKTVKMQITALKTTTPPPSRASVTTPPPPPPPPPTAISREVTVVQDIVEDKRKQSGNDSSSGSKYSSGICNNVIATGTDIDASCEDREMIASKSDPSYYSVRSNPKSLIDKQIVKLGENYMVESKIPLLDPKDQEKRNKRKFYWYGSHKLVKPIKDIPLRFQLMLAETNAEKTRCEGRPIILRQKMDVTYPFMTSENALGPDTTCLIPSVNYDQAQIIPANGLTEKKDKSGLLVKSSPGGVYAVSATSTGGVPVTNSSGGLGTSLSPITQPIPSMYAMQMYNSSCNLDGPTSPVGNITASASSTSAACTISVTGAPANSVSNNLNNACCMQLSTAPTYAARMHPSQMTLPAQAPFYLSAPPIAASNNASSSSSPSSSSVPYVTTQPYPQATALPPAFIPGTSSLGNTPFGLGSATNPSNPFPQYTPCISYTQNAKYTVTAVPQ